MQKTILITGSTDGIGLEAARIFASQGHQILLHGRSPTKLEEAEKTLSSTAPDANFESYLADLSRKTEVETLSEAVIKRHTSLDILINNAGVYNTPSPITQDGLDVRFTVNTFAPYLLTQRLLPLMNTSGRVINLSSAAQSPVDFKALAGQSRVSDAAAYAQSKLALTMWSRAMALSLENNGPAVIALNPGSMLGSKMVKQAFGVSGGDIRIGAEIICRSALEDAFSTASGQYFDNDVGQFSAPHADALNRKKIAEVVHIIETVLAEKWKT